MVTSEMIARQSGAGNILFNALDMGQYDTVYAMIIIIGAMGIGLDALFERLRARLVAWSEPGIRHPAELRMNARAVSTRRSARDRADRAADRAVAGDSSFGYAPAALLPPPGARVHAAACSSSRPARFSRTIAATLFRLFAGFSIAVVLGVRHRPCRGGQPGRQRRGAADRARIGAVAEGRAVSGTVAAARFRP